MWKFIVKSYAEITGLLVFFIYLQTVSSTVTEFDSGELITVQATLGIAHPTGYPLFTVIGYLFSQIPLPISVAYKLSLLCAIWCAATVIVLVKTMKLLLDNIQFFTSKNIKQSDFPFSPRESLKAVTATFTGLVFAFSYTFWAQATKVEVYALQLFLSSMIIYFAFRAFLINRDQLMDNRRILSNVWLPVAVFVGLGFANHMMTLYLLPFLIYLFFKKNKLSWLSGKNIIYLTLLSFTVSVVLYLYLLLSAKWSSGLNIWLQPNLTDWINHIRGKMYHGLIVESFGETSKQFKAFGESLMVHLGRESRRGGDFSINIILIFAGIILSVITVRKLFYALTLIILTAFLVSMSYAILDIQEYFLLIFYTFSTFAGICLYYILSLKKIEASRILRGIIPSILIFIMILNNFNEIDRSNNHLVEDYVSAVLNSMSPNTYLLTNKWGYIEAPAFYLQKVEGKRLDLEIINLELLFYNSYKMDIKKSYNMINDSSHANINIHRLLSSVETYIAPEVIRDYIQKQRLVLDEYSYLVPDILLFKLTNSDEYIPAKAPDFNIRLPKYASAVDNHIINLVCSMLVNRINYEMYFNKIDRAKIYYKKLEKDFPMYSIPSELEFLGENK